MSAMHLGGNMSGAALFAALQALCDKAAEDGDGPQQAPSMRHEIVQWMLRFAPDHPQLLIDVWQTELLGARPERWPELLYLIGDVLQSASVERCPDFVCSLALLMPALWHKLLCSPLLGNARVEAQGVHRALKALTRQWRSNPQLPPEWVGELQRLHEARMSRAGVGWVSDSLSECDRHWHELAVHVETAEDLWQKLQAAHTAAEAAADGSPETMGTIRALGSRWSRATGELERCLESVRKEIAERVLAPVQALQEQVKTQLEETQEQYCTAQRRFGDDDSAEDAEASDVKRRRVDPDSDGDGGDGDSGRSVDDMFAPEPDAETPAAPEAAPAGAGEPESDDDDDDDDDDFDEPQQVRFTIPATTGRRHRR